MSWRDRPYAGDNPGYSDYGGGAGNAIFGGMDKPPTAVKWLLIINFAAFFVQLISGDLGSMRLGFMTNWFAVYGYRWWQIWRLVSFQFLHGGIWHIAFNMLGLYFMGTALERRFGTRWFLSYYLTCGAAAGVLYILLSMLWNNAGNPLVGASGGVYAAVLAAAVYFPHFRLILLFFPVPIRLAAVLFFGVTIMTVLAGVGGLRSGEVWSQVAHLGGLAAGGSWLLIRHRRPPEFGGEDQGESLGQKIRRGQWEKKMREMREIQQQADAILEKIHSKGIGSVTAREKRILKRATDMQKEQEDRIRDL